MFTTSIRKLDQNHESHVADDWFLWHTINRKQSGTNTKECLNFHTSVSSQKLRKRGCCALGLNALCLAHLRCWCWPESACGTSSVQQGGLVTELRRAERGGDKGRMSNRAGTQRRENDGIYFCSRILIFLMALVGGELFRDSNEHGGLSTTRRADDCRSLVCCLFSSFLLSTSLPACVHGLWLINKSTKNDHGEFKYAHTSYLHIMTIRSVVGVHICSNVRRNI